MPRGRRPRRVLGAALAGTLALAGCAAAAGQPGDLSAAATPGGPATTRPTATPLTTGPAASPSPAGTFTMAFAGDVHFEGVVRRRLHEPATTFGPIAAVLRAADLTMVNLETAVTDRGRAEPKTYRFRAPATAFTALREAGVDVVSMANNHGRDFGAVGLADSLAAAAAARFPVVGIGRNAEEAFAPYEASVRGNRVAVLSATHVLDGNLRAAWTAGPDRPGLASAYDEARLLVAVRAARARADTVVVYLHWGEERVACPTARQRALAERLVRAGADVVVGSHAHVLLGGGRLGPAYVHYGLGNFLWYSANSPAANRTGVLTLTLTGRSVTGAAWTPAEVHHGVPVPLAGTAADRARLDWESQRRCTGLDPLTGPTH